MRRKHACHAEQHPPIARGFSARSLLNSPRPRKVGKPDQRTWLAVFWVSTRQGSQRSEIRSTVLFRYVAADNVSSLNRRICRKQTLRPPVAFLVAEVQGLVVDAHVLPGGCSCRFILPYFPRTRATRPTRVVMILSGKHQVCPTIDVAATLATIF